MMLFFDFFFEEKGGIRYLVRFGGLGDVYKRKEKSIVEITEVNGMYQGRVVKLLPASKRTHCEKCDGHLKDKPLTGMTILWDLKITDNGGRDGKVLDLSLIHI